MSLAGELCDGLRADDAKDVGPNAQGPQERVLGAAHTGAAAEYDSHMRPLLIFDFADPVAVFDNWRILHGRSAFTGQRRLCGGYSEFLSSASDCED